MKLTIVAAAGTGRHLEEIGLLLAAIGGLALIVSAGAGIRRIRENAGNPLTERWLLLTAGVLVLVGCILAVSGLHYH